MGSVSLAGCGSEKEESLKQAEENNQEVPIKAVYLKNSYGEGIFVELDNETPFFGTLPEEIVEEDGSGIVLDDMRNGDVYEVHGNGIMLESYPGQYPGITKLVRIETENQEYAEKYKQYLEQFCPEPDTAQPPELSVEYRQPMAVMNAIVERGGYEWKKNLDGESTSVEIADVSPVLKWDDETLREMRLEEETEFLLRFSYEPQMVKVLRWPLTEREKAQNEEQTAEGEPVRVEQKEEGFVFEGEPGFVYEVTGEWAEGTAQYGFWTGLK